MALSTDTSQIQNPNGQGNLPLANPNANMGALNPTPTPQINTAQPSPTNTNVPAPGSAPTGDAQTIANQQAAAKLGIAIPGVGGKISSDAQAMADKYKAGLQTVQKSGTPPPSSQGDANSTISSVVQPTDTSGQDQIKAITQQLQNDPAITKLISDYQATQTAETKQQTLEEQYTKLSSDLGLPALNTKLINMKSVMDGTEDDIRNEITKAGGFATNSQVLALTAARNKSIIQDYNLLLQTRDNAQSQLTTMIGLAEKDKTLAHQQMSDTLNFDEKLATYEQTMKTNAISAYDKIISTPGYGYQALFQSTGGDPSAVSMIEKTLNLPPGMLAQLGSITPPGKYTVVKGGTDAYGNPLPDQIFNSATGQLSGSGSYPGSGVSDASGIGAGGTSVGSATGIIGSKNLGITPSKLSFDQYGLLANTNFKPANLTDQLAQKYIDQYIKNGTVPTASSLGRSMKPEAMAQVDSRARELYFQATGSPLPSPQIIKGYQQIIDSNNKLANNLLIQEQTVGANVDFSLANMKKNDLNSAAFAPLNSAIDNVRLMFNDPATSQLIAQNTTIQNELGSLLAVKNASGTTVYDKLASAGIIKNTDTPAVIKTKVTALLQEAANFAGSLANANANMYKQVDPLLQDPNNPARNQMKVEAALNKTNTNYNTAVSKTPSGYIPVLDNATGLVGYILPNEFSSAKYIKL